jgi:bifunctional DNA-binding transcriptional regulator/antitoxin component of YhaV-PrlF toxin-antitoxin module
MSLVKIVKSFSKGQIIIPKEFREVFGMSGEFWLKLYIDRGRIVAEPFKDQNATAEKKDWAEKLLKMKGNWFKEGEIKENRDRLKDERTILDSLSFEERVRVRWMLFLGYLQVLHLAD